MKEFLKAIYSGADKGYITIFTAEDKKCQSFGINELDKLAKYVTNLSGTKNVFYGVGIRKEKFDGFNRGKNEDVLAVTCLWYDLDIKSEAHKQTELPGTQEEAITFLSELEEKPSIIVNSGNGLHVYWLLEKPLYIMMDEYRKNMSEMLKGFQKHLNNEAKKKGWVLDNTSDLARVLRVPSTLNLKLDTKPECKTMQINELRYSVDKFFKYKQTNEEAESKYAREDFKGETTTADKCFSCKFIQHCKDNAENLPEPYWHAMISNLALAKDGETVCHELSSKYKGYSKKETENKVQRARQEQKPHTCKYIKNSLMFNCGDCGAKCKAPIGLAVVTKLEKALSVVTKDFETVEEIFSDEVLNALVCVQKESVRDYSVFKAKNKEKFKLLNLVDLEKALSQIKQRQFSKNGGVSDDESTLIELEGIDLDGAIVPQNYMIDEQEIRRIVPMGDGFKTIDVCPQPLIFEARLINVDVDREKVQIAFKVDGRWKRLVRDRSEFFNKTAILKYSDDKLKVSTNNNAEIVEYLAKYEKANGGKIKMKNSIDRFGWYGDKTFFPYVSGDLVYEPDSQTAEMFKHVKSRGSFDEWKSMIAKVKENNFARLIVAASFASPLLEKTAQRNFVMHTWAASKAGKTAVLKAAISVWGDPTKMISSFYSTKVGLEQMAATLKNLPFGIDERQVNDDKRMSLESMVYILGQGQGKTRGAKNGGNAETGYWNNIIITTGEEPLLDNKAKNGAVTRSIEFCGKPTDDEDMGKWIHTMTARHYGHAGKIYMKKICELLAENEDALINDFDRFTAEFSKRGHKTVHADYCATLALGDYYASKFVFGVSEETAFNDALNMALSGYENAKENQQKDITVRAWNFVKDWIVSNRNKFDDQNSLQIYGVFDKGIYSVIPNILEDALRDAGFMVAATIAGFREKGYLICNKKNGRKDSKKRVTVKDNRIYCYQFNIELDEGVIQPL